MPQSWLIVLRCACGGRPGNEAKAVAVSQSWLIVLHCTWGKAGNEASTAYINTTTHLWELPCS